MDLCTKTCKAAGTADSRTGILGSVDRRLIMDTLSVSRAIRGQASAKGMILSSITDMHNLRAIG